MNKKLVGGAIAIVVVMVVFVALGGIGFLKLWIPADPEAVILERQVEDLKSRNVELESQNAKYVIEIRDLTAQVRGLSGAQIGGMEIEEIRKALAVREAELDRREQRLVRTEVQLRVDRTKLEADERQFYNDRGLKIEEIGQAKEIKENHARMLASLAQAEERAESAEERANSWLMAIYTISTLFLVGIFVFVGFLYRTATNDRRIDMARRTVGSVSLSARDRNLLMASLGGRIIVQPPDDDSEH